MEQELKSTRGALALIQVEEQWRVEMRRAIQIIHGLVDAAQNRRESEFEWLKTQTEQQACMQEVIKDNITKMITKTNEAIALQKEVWKEELDEMGLANMPDLLNSLTPSDEVLNSLRDEIAKWNPKLMDLETNVEEIVTASKVEVMACMVRYQDQLNHYLREESETNRKDTATLQRSHLHIEQVLKDEAKSIRMAQNESVNECKELVVQSRMVLAQVSQAMAGYVETVSTMEAANRNLMDNVQAMANQVTGIQDDLNNFLPEVVHHRIHTPRSTGHRTPHPEPIGKGGKNRDGFSLFSGKGLLGAGGLERDWEHQPEPVDTSNQTENVLDEPSNSTGAQSTDGRRSSGSTGCCFLM